MQQEDEAEEEQGEEQQGEKRRRGGEEQTDKIREPLTEVRELCTFDPDHCDGHLGTLALRRAL